MITMSSHIVNNNGLESLRELRVLAVADMVSPQLYHCDVNDWLGPVDLLVSCGDLPPDYLDFLMSMIGVPMVHVLGNHCYVPHDPVTGRCSSDAYLGVFNLHGKLADYRGLLMAGVEGCPMYSRGPHQYTEQQVAWNLLRMYPSLMLEKARSGRYLDLLVTHAPPRGIHDNEDVAHKGFGILRSFIERFKPALVLHGHTHRYDPTLPVYSRHGDTHIVNVYGHCLIDLVRTGERPGWHVANIQADLRSLSARSHTFRSQKSEVRRMTNDE
jgi:hypothetical protein